MKKLSIFIFLSVFLFACKQKAENVASILKLRSVSVDGVALNKDEMKAGSATVEYKDGKFEVKVEAEMLNVKALLYVDGSASEITENIAAGTPIVVRSKKEVNCILTFEGEGLSKVEYKFKVRPAKKEEIDVPHLLSLMVADKKIEGEDVKETMSLSLSSLSERIPFKWETDKPCVVKIVPEPNEGMLDVPFDEDFDIFINLENASGKKTYKLTLRVANANVTSSELFLTYLKVNGEEVKELQDAMHISFEYDSPANIAIEALANNGVTPKFEPELQNGKIALGYNGGATEVKIKLEREGFASRTYSILLERKAEIPALRSLKVNGHIVAIQDEMNVKCSYSKNKALIEAVGKFGTNVVFSPSLTNGELDLPDTTEKKVDIIVSKDGLENHTYVLKLQREAAPSTARPSKVESIMIASGLNAERNFEEIDSEFPNTKQEVKYAIHLNQYTLKIEKLNAADAIEVSYKGSPLSPAKSDGNTNFYNITLDEIKSDVSVVEDIKIKITEQNMQEVNATLKLCYEGAYAQAFKMPVASIAGVKFEPLLTKMNYVKYAGSLSIDLQAWDPLSRVEVHPFNPQLGEEVLEVAYTLTTCADRKLDGVVRFKLATGKERTLLSYLKFYPETPDISEGRFREYGNFLSPRFRSEDNTYKLELNPGDWKVFFDTKPIIEGIEMNITVDGQTVGKDEYYKNGNDVYALYAFSIEPNQVKKLQINLRSDTDSSIENTYEVNIIAPDDGTVARFTTLFTDENGKELKTLPAIKKDRGIRLPPQNPDSGKIKMKLTAKSQGTKFDVQLWQMAFNEQGNPQILQRYRVDLDSNGEAEITTGMGMFYVVVQATARNGFSKVTQPYEIYRFTHENKLHFEIGSESNADNLDRIDMSDWQQIIPADYTAPLIFKCKSEDGSLAKYRIAVYEDYKAEKPFKPEERKEGNRSYFVLNKKPKIILAGVIMPDNAMLYYAIFLR